MTIHTPAPGNAAGKAKPMLISRARLCGMLSANETTINRWVRSFEDFPQPLRPPSGPIRFRLAEVEAYVAGLPRCEYEDHGFDPSGS